MHDHLIKFTVDKGVYIVKRMSKKKLKKILLQVFLVMTIFLLYQLIKQIDRKIAINRQEKKEEMWNFSRHELNGTIVFDARERPKFCNGCFEFGYHMLKEQPATCQNQENIHLVFLISTTPLSLKKRMIIRDTWASYSKKNTANIRYAFLLGEITEEPIQEMINTEDKFYRDILQADFPENYYTLTIKTLMGYHWAVKHCPSNTFIVKTDDDVFINIPAVLDMIKKHKNLLQRSIGGFCKKDIEPVRDVKSKYYVSHVEYPQKKFPGYCSGTGYVTSINVVKRVVEVSRNIPFFHLEDVYIAFCLDHLNFTLQHINGFNTVYNEEEHADLCELKSNSVLVVHNFKKQPSFLKEIWNKQCDI